MEVPPLWAEVVPKRNFEVSHRDENQHEPMPEDARHLSTDEWREIVLERQREFNVKLDTVVHELTEVKLVMMTIARADKLDERIRSLEDSRMKFMGVVLAAGAVWTVIVGLIMRFLK
jgi:hypothetical protein